MRSNSLINRLSDRLIDWSFVHLPIAPSIDALIDWLLHPSMHWLIDCSIHRCIDWLIAPSIDALIDWLCVFPMACSCWCIGLMLGCFAAKLPGQISASMMTDSLLEYLICNLDVDETPSPSDVVLADCAGEACSDRWDGGTYLSLGGVIWRLCCSVGMWLKSMRAIWVQSADFIEGMLCVTRFPCAARVI